MTFKTSQPGAVWVVSSDAHRLGRFIGMIGEHIEFMTEGAIARRERLPADWVCGMDATRVHLSVTKAETGLSFLRVLGADWAPAVMTAVTISLSAL